MKIFKKNLFRFISMNFRIIFSLLLVLVGIIMVFLSDKSCNKDIMLSIGSGVFSSALITFIFEILSRKKENSEIVKSLKELKKQMELYNHRTIQCYKCIESILPTADIILKKNMLYTEAYKIILIGNILLNEINKFKSNYSLCVSYDLIDLLNSTYIEIEENMSFITSASSSSTLDFNVKMIKNERIVEYMQQLQKYIQNNKVVYYQIKSK